MSINLKIKRKWTNSQKNVFLKLTERQGIIKAVESAVTPAPEQPGVRSPDRRFHHRPDVQGTNNSCFTQTRSGAAHSAGISASKSDKGSRRADYRPQTEMRRPEQSLIPSTYLREGDQGTSRPARCYVSKRERQLFNAGKSHIGRERSRTTPGSQTLITPSTRALQAPGEPPQRHPSAASKVAGVEMTGEHKTCTERLVGDAGVRGPQGGHGRDSQHSPCRGLWQTQHTDAKAHSPAAAPSGG